MVSNKNYLNNIYRNSASPNWIITCKIKFKIIHSSLVYQNVTRFQLKLFAFDANYVNFAWIQIFYNYPKHPIIKFGHKRTAVNSTFCTVQMSHLHWQRASLYVWHKTQTHNVSDTYFRWSGSSTMSRKNPCGRQTGLRSRSSSLWIFCWAESTFTVMKDDHWCSFGRCF